MFRYLHGPGVDVEQCINDFLAADESFGDSDHSMRDSAHSSTTPLLAFDPFRTTDVTTPSFEIAPFPIVPLL